MNENQRAQLIEDLRTLPQRIFYAKRRESALSSEFPIVKGMTSDKFMAFIESPEHRQRLATMEEARHEREMLEQQFESALALARMLAVPVPPKEED